MALSAIENNIGNGIWLTALCVPPPSPTIRVDLEDIKQPPPGRCLSQGFNLSEALIKAEKELGGTPPAVNELSAYDTLFESASGLLVLGKKDKALFLARLFTYIGDNCYGENCNLRESISSDLLNAIEGLQSAETQEVELPQIMRLRKDIFY